MWTIKTENGTVATIERDGRDWRAMIQLPRDAAGVRSLHTRYFTAHDQLPDGGLTRVTRALRREFGIAGTYRRPAT